MRLSYRWARAPPRPSEALAASGLVYTGSRDPRLTNISSVAQTSDAGPAGPFDTTAMACDTRLGHNAGAVAFNSR